MLKFSNFDKGFSGGVFDRLKILDIIS